MTSPIYAFDPDASPDSDFAPGELKHLVVGNHGRLLDTRRTPVTITALALERAAFEVRIEAFEDMGARWETLFGMSAASSSAAPVRP